MNIAEILLVSFIINLGIALGAGLYEARMILPLWFHKTAGGSYEAGAQAMHNLDTGRKFWAFVTTMPLTLLTIVNLVFACKAAEPLYGWWLSAALIILLERIGTFAFFIPTAIKFQKEANYPYQKNQTWFFGGYD